jgi:signal transduction histidine kinase
MRTALEVERIEKEKALELDQMKSRFFTNISHEFRTPLTLILGTLQKLSGRNKEDPALREESIEVMERNAGRLQNLINQLLDVSRLESGKMSLKVSRGDMEGFLRPLLFSFLSLAEAR